MNEDYLQYVWRYQRLPHGRLKSTAGREVTVLFQGHWNKHAGPDFLEAKLRIGRELWHGSVEIHVRSSDWRRHKHQGDVAYRNVILHVVYEDDEPLVNEEGMEVPTLILKGLLNEQHLAAYRNFMERFDYVPCGNQLHRVGALERTSWLQRMAVERLSERSKRAAALLMHYAGDWNAVWWQMLCRSFGFGLNQMAYEAMAESLNWQVVAKHAHRPVSLEALLLVHSGWFSLDGKLRTNDVIKQEFEHFRKLHSLEPRSPAVWHRGRMKPANHPRVRLGQLAALLNHGMVNWCAVSNINDLDELLQRFRVQAQMVGLTMKAAPGLSEPIGKSAAELIVANAFIPLAYHEAELQNRSEAKERLLHWMESLPKERNRVTKNWERVGWKADNLLETQGQIHLFNEYCCRKKCVSCSIGVTLLNQAQP